MTNAAAVTKNALTLTALKIASPAISTIVVVAISRKLGAEGLGRYTLAATAIGVVTNLTPLGLNAFLMREGARNLNFPKLVANAVGLTAAVALLISPFIAGLGYWLHYDVITRQAISVMSLAIMPATLLTLCDAVFISRQRSVYIGAYTVADLIIRVGIAALLLVSGYNVVAVIGALVVGQFVALCVAGRLSHGLGVSLRPDFDRDTLRRLIAAAPTFLSISVFATIFWQIDVVMLSVMSGMVDVGLYGAAYRIADLVRILPQSLCMAVYPLISQAAVVNVTDMRRIGTETLRVMWMIVIPIVVGGSVLASQILVFTVGEQFRGASTTLTILLWTAVPYTFVRYYSYVTVAANRERVDLLLNVALSAVNIGLNIVLIPSHGAFGAALATLISMCAFAAGQYLYVSCCLPAHLAPLPQITKPVAAAGLMALFVWVRRTDQVVLLIGAAAVMYIALLLLTRSLSLRDFRLLRRSELA